jgi:hypothetical protein
LNAFTEINEVELRNFIVTGAEFFRWNSGKNTPNILIELNERIGAFRHTMKEASDSSAKLATALNRFTLALVIVDRFENGVGTFYADYPFKGKPTRVRFLWTQLSTTPRWEQAFSTKGEKTWETNWIMDFTKQL